jgi:hypothetical protein
MNWAVAAGWGALGGAAAVLIGLMATVKARRWRFPWRDDPDSLWPRVFVYAGSLVLGAAVAAAAHGQMKGPWPAFIIGVGAPGIVRAALSQVEVEEIGPDPAVAELPREAQAEAITPEPVTSAEGAGSGGD